mgnify:CR=1 FL=1
MRAPPVEGKLVDGVDSLLSALLDALDSTSNGNFAFVLDSTNASTSSRTTTSTIITRGLAICRPIFLLVKDSKEEEETDHLADLNNTRKEMVEFKLTAAIVTEDDENCVNDDHTELDQLSHGQIALPRAGNPKEAHGIIGVHEDVDNGI